MLLHLSWGYPNVIYREVKIWAALVEKTLDPSNFCTTLFLAKKNFVLYSLRIGSIQSEGAVRQLFSCPPLGLW